MSCACKRTVRLGAALIVALATLVLPWAPRAHAETSADVQKQVNVLLDRIRDLHRQAALLGQAYDRSLDQVRASVSGDAEADRAVDDLSLTARLSQARLSGRVRGLYMAGGPLAVYSTLMSSGSLADLADRTAMARRVLQADMFQASEGQTRVDRASAHAKVTSTAVIERTRAEHTLAELSRRLHETLSEQQDVMKLLRTRLDKVKAHEAEMARQAELARQARAREAARLKMQADSEQAMQMSMQQAVSAVQSMLDQQQAATDALEQQQQQQQHRRAVDDPSGAGRNPRDPVPQRATGHHGRPPEPPGAVCRETDHGAIPLRPHRGWVLRQRQRPGRPSDWSRGGLHAQLRQDQPPGEGRR